MSIVIGIPTRGRHGPLLRLIRSIVVSCAGHPVQPCVLVMQNDADFTLQDDPALRAAAGSLELIVKHEPRAGLCQVRNALFDAAQDMGHDWFFGVDDDEWVGPDWYAQFAAQTADRPSSEILFGPCVLCYDDSLSRYRTPDQIRPLDTGKVPRFFATHNYAIHRDLFAQSAAGYRFDAAFDQTGGEDEEFFGRIKRAGDGAMVWIAEAQVYEERIQERGLLIYRLHRSRRVILSRYHLRARHDALFGKKTQASTPRIAILCLRKIVRGGLRTVYHGVQIPMRGDVARQKCGLALTLLWQGLGLLDFLRGVQIPHYSGDTIDNSNVRVDG
jgi:succinoglycan biosynthesis protein ExoM